MSTSAWGGTPRRARACAIRGDQEHAAHDKPVVDHPEGILTDRRRENAERVGFRACKAAAVIRALGGYILWRTRGRALQPRRGAGWPPETLEGAALEAARRGTMVAAAQRVGRLTAGRPAVRADGFPVALRRVEAISHRRGRRCGASHIGGRGQRRSTACSVRRQAGPGAGIDGDFFFSSLCRRGSTARTDVGARTDPLTGDAGVGAGHSGRAVKEVAFRLLPVTPVTRGRDRQLRSRAPRRLPWQARDDVDALSPHLRPIGVFISTTATCSATSDHQLMVLSKGVRRRRRMVRADK